MAKGVAIVGCGGIGSRRGQAVGQVDGLKLVVGADVFGEAAARFGERFQCDQTTDWQAAVARDDVDIVVVSTANNAHAEVSIAAMDRGKHVLCEKPLARNPGECEQMVAAARRNDVKLKTGFNHRYSHQAWKGHELLEEGAIGRILFIRGCTGHGQGEAFSKRWFGNFELSGGGTFLDNGVHLLDLSRWFLGDFAEATGFVSTDREVLGQCEDNGFGIYRTEDGRICQLQSSWTQWHGYLLLEVFGEEGSLLINYDDSSCTWHRRGSETTVWRYGGVPDRSWERGLEELSAAIDENREPLANGVDGWRAVQMAYAVYESNRSGQAVKL